MVKWPGLSPDFHWAFLYSLMSKTTSSLLPLLERIVRVLVEESPGISGMRTIPV